MYTKHGGYDLDEERDQDAEDRALDAAAGLDRDPVDEGRLVPEPDPDEPSSRPIEEAA
jgi:hypothetical protein